MADRTRLGSLQFHAETAAQFGNTSVTHVPNAGEFLRAWATEKELKEEPIEEEFAEASVEEEPVEEGDFQDEYEPDDDYE